ncbi:hypothetical protein AB0D45_06280 [Streptomyces sp. NPDC048352]|uniref:hypothetical protein n=1 Tax=Streptomyces sp. NPDC048352 TaxID=3154718 RepID=UPI0034447FC1
MSTRDRREVPASPYQCQLDPQPPPPQEDEDPQEDDEPHDEDDPQDEDDPPEDEDPPPPAHQLEPDPPDPLPPLPLKRTAR